MLYKKTVARTVMAVPPDIDSPPQHIPLHSMETRYRLIEELGNGSFGSVSLAKANFDLINTNNNNNDFNDFLNIDESLTKSKIQNTLMDATGMELENVLNKSQRLVAIKTMMTKLPTLHDYTRVREIKFILSIPANKYLIQMFEIFIDTTNFQLHIVMECMEQNLYQMMRHRKRRVFSIPSLKSILGQVLAGIKHIHEQNYFHRDIKPENILISPSTKYFDKNYLLSGNYQDNYVVKLADFGLSRHVNNKNPYTAYVSTRWYRSPEILLRSGYYSRPLDIWAFGCVAVEVTMFKPLFPGSNEMDQIWKILEVLGTPHKTRESVRTGYQPQGGSWEISKDLAHSLNLKFPYVEGTTFESIICSSQLTSLTEVIKACLRWNPNERATAFELGTMPFFKGTVADPYVEKSKRDISTQNSTVPVQTTTNAEQALIFAGINSNSYHSRQLIFHSESNCRNELIPNPNNSHIHSNNENVDIHYHDQNLKDASTSKTKTKPIDIMKKHNKRRVLDQQLTLKEFLNEPYNLEDEIEDALLDDDVVNVVVDEDEIIGTDTYSTMSESQDEIELSKSIENNISMFQIPNGLTIQDPEGNLRQLADDIQALEEDTDSFSQYYEKLLIHTNDIMNNNNEDERVTSLSNCLQQTTNTDDNITLPFINNQNYIHSNNDINNHHSGINKQDSDTSMFPVNNLLNNMSIDDSFNSSINVIPCVVPRSFVLPQTEALNSHQQNQSFKFNSQHHQHGNVTF